MAVVIMAVSRVMTVVRGLLKGLDLVDKVSES